MSYMIHLLNMLTQDHRSRSQLQISDLNLRSKSQIPNPRVDIPTRDLRPTDTNTEIQTQTHTEDTHHILWGVEPMDVVYVVWECMGCDECDHL